MDPPKILKPLPKANLLLFPFFFFSAFQWSCQEGDIQVINQVKTFEPQWSNLREDLSWLERNIARTETRFEQDILEIRTFQNRLQDTLTMRRFFLLNKNYDQIVLTRDSIRRIFDITKSKHTHAVEEFHTWEAKVTEGEIAGKDAMARLKEFRGMHAGIDSTSISLRSRLESITRNHNLYLREMAKSVDVFTNFDVELN